MLPGMSGELVMMMMFVMMVMVILVLVVAGVVEVAAESYFIVFFFTELWLAALTTHGRLLLQVSPIFSTSHLCSIMTICLSEIRHS